MSSITQSSDFIAGVAFQSFRQAHPGVAFLIKTILETEGAPENVGSKLRDRAEHLAKIAA